MKLINAVLKSIGIIAILYGAWIGLEKVAKNPSILIPTGIIRVGIILISITIEQSEYSKTVEEQIKEKL